MSIVNTCNTYFVMHSGPCYLFHSFRSIFVYNSHILFTFFVNFDTHTHSWNYIWL